MHILLLCNIYIIYLHQSVIYRGGLSRGPSREFSVCNAGNMPRYSQQKRNGGFTSAQVSELRDCENSFGFLRGSAPAKHHRTSLDPRCSTRISIYHCVQAIERNCGATFVRDLFHLTLYPATFEFLNPSVLLPTIYIL